MRRNIGTSLVIPPLSLFLRFSSLIPAKAKLVIQYEDGTNLSPKKQTTYGILGCFDQSRTVCRLVKKESPFVFFPSAQSEIANRESHVELVSEKSQTLKQRTNHLGLGSMNRFDSRSRPIPQDELSVT